MLKTILPIYKNQLIILRAFSVLDTWKWGRGLRQPIYSWQSPVYFLPAIGVVLPRFGMMKNGNLQISQQLSNDYTNKFTFAAAHSNIVAAGYAFVEFLNSPDLANLPPSDWPDPQ